MKPITKITPHDWMNCQKTQSVMKALGGYDETPKALFVGGCVRNALMGRAITDIDIATIHRPDKVMKMLLDAGIRAIPTGLEHGTVTALVDDQRFEITTLRRDVETDGRHAVIAFTEDWLEDSQRRDFTINTLLASPSGDIFDPTARGFSDQRDRRVVFVGDPAQRIAEDYLRILRFFRFHAQYGDGVPDAASLEACRIHADKVSKLSKERITQEFLKILFLPNTPAILNLMFAHDIMVHPDMRGKRYKRETMERLVDMQDRFEVANVMARLALLCGFEAERWSAWLVLPNAQVKQFAEFGAILPHLKSASLKRIRALVYEYGNQPVVQSYFISLAIDGNNPNMELMDIARYWQSPSFPITGDDLIAKGIAPGRDLGKKLKALEEKWIKSDFKTLPKI